MVLKLDRDLVAVKCHFFFFFAALGPLLPQMNVFGKQLGVSPLAMGLVTAVLPLLWALAKPAFGYLVDFFPNQRKAIFMMLICLMSGSYCGLWGLPVSVDPLHNHADLENYTFQLNNTVYIDSYQSLDETRRSLLENYECQWNASDYKFNIYLSHAQYVNAIYIRGKITNESCAFLQMDLSELREGELVCVPKAESSLICLHRDFVLATDGEREKRGIDKGAGSENGVNPAKNHFEDKLTSKESNFKYVTQNDDLTRSTENTVTEKSAKQNDSNKEQTTSQSKLLSVDSDITKDRDNRAVDLNKSISVKNNLDAKSELDSIKNKDGVSTNNGATENDDGFYTSAVFWWFVVLMCVGTVAFNVANCIGDAVCFDVLGPDRAPKYGSQRAWGTAGYGLTALLGGWLVDAVSSGAHKDFYPAFLLAAGFTVCDLVCCRKLKLPRLSSPTDSGKALREVLRMPKVLVFIVFAVIAGTFDSFIIYYMFWFLEELAEATGHSGKIKLIEGVVVAGQSFVGELLFFHYSGRIIRRLGYGTTMSIALLSYGARMLLVSFITNPWHLVIIESVMQGPTYALCYASIVGYAATVAPEGYSATVQGIVAGMDDGLGFALGSLVGGQMYSRLGGRGAFRVMAAAAAAAALAHVLARRCVLERAAVSPVPTPEEGEKMLQVQLATLDDSVYRDTVLPLSSEGVKLSDSR